MKNTRSVRAKLNIVVSLLGQLITLLCGLVVPRLMLSAFGSEANGAAASITQFLAYITLLEGGIGGVARAALYKPLADHDTAGISAVMAELQRFFRVIAYIFLGYALILACSFSKISHVEVFGWGTTFLLVIVISISTFAQYFIGITNSVLLQAAQKTYVTTAISIAATIANTVLTVLLVYAGCSLLTVKLASSCIFVLRPMALQFYVKRTFAIAKVTGGNKTYLKQKWTGLGQHIAFFLHSNTDIMILTVFANLSLVSVYSVYNMIVAHIQSLTASFSSGMEALFGEMIAKEEYAELNRTFDKYETLISVVSVIMMSVTAVLIMPFISLYTAGITDANYWEPLFALTLILASLLYCLRMPYHAVVIAAGHFKQTNLAAYGEAILNVGLSILLVNRLGLIGVAIGTMVATAFRFAYYVWYLSKNIACRKITLFIKRSFTNVACFLGSFFIGSSTISRISIDDYWIWVMCGVVCVILSVIVTIGGYSVFYRKDMKLIREMILKRKK